VLRVRVLVSDLQKLGSALRGFQRAKWMERFNFPMLTSHLPEKQQANDSHHLPPLCFEIGIFFIDLTLAISLFSFSNLALSSSGDLLP
jgi:hypothetical protein